MTKMKRSKSERNKERRDRLRRVAQLVADRMMLDDGSQDVPRAVIEVFKADMPEIAKDVESGRYTFNLAAVVIGYAGEELPHVIDAWDWASMAHRYGQKIRREVDRIQRAKFKKAKPSKKPSKKGNEAMTRDELTAYLSSLDDVTHERVAALVACHRAMPAGLDAVARVLGHGARKHNGGDLGVSAKWTTDECIDHAYAHAEIWLDRDDETSELHAAHAAARFVMVVEIVEGAERGEVW